jgi:hypothetical protein
LFEAAKLHILKSTYVKSHSTIIIIGRRLHSCGIIFLAH